MPRRPTRRNLATRAILLAALAASAPLAGCDNGRTRELLETRQKLRDAQDRVDALQAQNTQLADQLRDAREQLATLRRLGDNRIENLPTIERIQLGRYTGGIDTDDQPGHDAVRVLLEPIDRDGHAIKSAGEITVQLFDLGGGEGERLIAEKTFPVDEARAHWKSGLGTYRYSLEVPLKIPPPRKEITVRVTFTEYLTGKTFTAQKVVSVELPPSTQPANG